MLVLFQTEYCAFVAPPVTIKLVDAVELSALLTEPGGLPVDHKAEHLQVLRAAFEESSISNKVPPKSQMNQAHQIRWR